MELRGINNVCPETGDVRVACSSHGGDVQVACSSHGDDRSMKNFNWQICGYDIAWKT